MQWLDGYRKFVAVILSLVLSTGLLLTHQINADQWVELNKFVLPAFMAANLGELWLKGQSKPS
jgi:hypothetical protein